MLVLLNQRLHAIDTIPLAPIKYICNKANRMLYYVIALISNNIVLLIISILDKYIRIIVQNVMLAYVALAGAQIHAATSEGIGENIA